MFALDKVKKEKKEKKESSASASSTASSSPSSSLPSPSVVRDIVSDRQRLLGHADTTSSTQITDEWEQLLSSIERLHSTFGAQVDAEATSLQTAWVAAKHAITKSHKKKDKDKDKDKKDKKDKDKDNKKDAKKDVKKDKKESADGEEGGAVAASSHVAPVSSALTETMFDLYMTAAMAAARFARYDEVCVFMLRVHVCVFVYVCARVYASVCVCVCEKNVWNG